MKDHRLIDQRSLEFDRVILGKLRIEPALKEKAKANLQRWLGTVSLGARPALLEWRDLLDGPLESLFQVLEGTDERSVRLRQSSPFCGFLTQEERTRILQEFQARESTSA